MRMVKTILPWILFVVALGALWYLVFRGKNILPSLPHNTATTTSTGSTSGTSGTSGIPARYPDGSFSVAGLFASPTRTSGDPLEVRAIVTATYECPPCPAGAQCKACDGANFTMADDNLPTSSRLKIYFDRGQAEAEAAIKSGQRLIVTTQFVADDSQIEKNAQLGYWVFLDYKKAN